MTLQKQKLARSSPDVRNADDFTFESYAQMRGEGFSGGLLLATRKGDPAEQYVVKHTQCCNAANEYVFSKLAEAVGAKMPKTVLFMDPSHSGMFRFYAVGSRLIEKLPVHAWICVDRDGTFKLTDYATKSETQITVDKPTTQKFLKSLIHECGILFWDEDLSDCGEEYLDEDIPEEQEETTSQGEPIWSIKLELNDGSDKEIVFYNRLRNEPQELYWALMGFFGPDEYKNEFPDVDGE